MTTVVRGHQRHLHQTDGRTGGETAHVGITRVIPTGAIFSEPIFIFYFSVHAVPH